MLIYWSSNSNLSDFILRSRFFIWCLICSIVNFKIISGTKKKEKSAMIKMFIYLVFFGLLAVIFLNIFDVNFGKWYVNIHLKDYIVDGLRGKLIPEEENERTIKRKAIEIEPKRKEIYNQSQSAHSNSPKNNKDLINVIPNVRKLWNEKSENITNDKNYRRDLQADSNLEIDSEIDPVEKVIEKSFQTKQNKK